MGKDLRKLAGALIRYNSVAHALMDAYPDIGLDVTNFKTLYNYWREPQNRKIFCDELAASMRFDPLNPERWYHVTFRHIASTKNGSAVLKYHYYNHVDLIMEAYPDIGLDRHRFLRRDIWTKMENLRNFFRELAEERGLDPHNARTWYSLGTKDILDRKGGGQIMNIYGTYAKAISSVFPDIIGLDMDTLEANRRR